MTRRWNELLMDDHQAAEKVIAAMENALARPSGPPPAMVAATLEFFTSYMDHCHNQKEEQHLFPLLTERGIPRQGGPLGVMLAEHERARELLAELTPVASAYAQGEQKKLGELRRVFGEYGALLKQHYWKENDILYPMGLRALRPEDEGALIAGFAALEDAQGRGTRARYYELAETIARTGEVEDLSFGLDRGVLAAVLNTLPVELSFVDADDSVRYFSHENKDKIFPRSRSAIGMKVQNCHPAKSVHMVNQILADFKAGRRDVAEFWIDLGAKKVHIRYFAVKDPAGKYVGCLEVVQDVTPIQALTGQKRLLDG